MTTPIRDYVNRYVQRQAVRLHMPGHKGFSLLGMEPYDITEIDGADSLYEADGIIQQSEQNAGQLFGANTFYSTEGSSLCIRAMLYLVTLYARQRGQPPRIAAGRNAHKTFLTAAALLDFELVWLYPEVSDSYLSCTIQPAALEQILSQSQVKPTAVYLTTPDYLGNQVDVEAIARVCHAHDILLLVDNAHGAYLKFLPQSLHPIDLGADLCCDSAHKTLPVLTGGAYLHVSPSAHPFFSEQAKYAMAMFGSTSPSYLILQSLDQVNRYLSEGYRTSLAQFVAEVTALKQRLSHHGIPLVGDEPLKLTMAAKPFGYTGAELAAWLRAENLVPEFYDPDHLVLMLTPTLTPEHLYQLERVLRSIPQRAEIPDQMPPLSAPVRVLSVREASLSKRETIPANQSAGRILAGMNISCPPAVPIVVCGERIDTDAVNCFCYYGIQTCTVIAE